MFTHYSSRLKTDLNSTMASTCVKREPHKGKDGVELVGKGEVR